jgi:hypothetical protein
MQLHLPVAEVPTLPVPQACRFVITAPCQVIKVGSYCRAFISKYMKEIVAGRLNFTSLQSPHQRLLGLGALHGCPRPALPYDPHP